MASYFLRGKNFQVLDWVWETCSFSPTFHFTFLFSNIMICKSWTLISKLLRREIGKIMVKKPILFEVQMK